MALSIKIDKRDTLFSKMIRERDNNRCVFCGKDGALYSLQNSHFWGRGNKTTRFDANNCDALCFKCHIENEGNKQGLYRTWKLEQLGEEGYTILERRARDTGRYGEYEKKIVWEILNEMYKNKEHLDPNWGGIHITQNGVYKIESLRVKAKQNSLQ